jgi:IS5 family transposase
LKHRYQLGYESLCREVSDSIAWRRFARIPLDQLVPHPTTLSKLVRRAGPGVIDQLNTALVGKLAADKQAAGRHHGRRRECGLPDRCGAAGARDRQAGRHRQAGAGRAAPRS